MLLNPSSLNYPKKIKGTLCREEIKVKKLNWILEKLEYVILI